MARVPAKAATAEQRESRRPALRLVQPTERAEPTAVKRSRPSSDVLARRDGNRLTLLTAALNCLGLVMVLSASSIDSISTAGTPWSLFEKQVMWTVIGIVTFCVARHVDLARLRQLATPMLCVSGLLLLVVLVPGFGKTVGGSSRWIGAGPIHIQPSEISKIAFALFVADLVARREHLGDEVRNIVRPVGVVLAGMAILILKQPDMGTAIVLVCIATSVLFAAGVDRKLLATVMGLIFACGTIVALAAPYRRERLLSFLHPFANASTSGYQVVQSLVALGSGHLTGTGIGGSVAKWNFLPNAWTDFIFAIIGNELGLVGSIAVLLAFVGFAYLGIRIAARATDRFSSLLAIGITCWIIAQAFINIGGVISILPETGIPLPFLSSGGSALVVALGAVGLLVNIARHQSVRTDRGTVRQAARRPVAANRTGGGTRRQAAVR